MKKFIIIIFFITIQMSGNIHIILDKTIDKSFAYEYKDVYPDDTIQVQKINEYYLVTLEGFKNKAEAYERRYLIDTSLEVIDDEQFYENEPDKTGTKDNTQLYKDLKKNNEIDIFTTDQRTLKEAIKLALKRDNLIKSSHHSLKQVEIALRESILANGVSLDWSSHNQLSYLNQNYSLKLTKVLYDSGENYYNTRKAEKTYRKELFKHRGIVQKRVYNTIKVYLDVVYLKETIRANRLYIKKLKKIQNIVEDKLETGALTKSNKNNIKASMLNALTNFKKVEAKYKNAVAYYRHIVGEDPDVCIPYQKSFNYNLKKTYAETEDLMFQNNINILQKKFELEASREDYKSVNSSLNSKIDFLIDSNVGQNYSSNLEENYNAKIKYSLNLYDSGRGELKKKKVIEKIDELRYKLDDAKRELAWDLTKVFNALSALKSNLNTVSLEIKARQKTTDIYLKQFRANHKDIFVLLELESKVNEAELNKIKIEQAYLLNQFAIFEKEGKLEYFINTKL